MSDALVLVADTDRMTDWSTLPHEVAVVLGYVGQPLCTPHVWTAAEVREVRAHGKAWAPIHTPPPGRFGLAEGQRAGALMVEELKRYPMLGPEPVFLDIEHASWALDQSATMAGVRAWQAVMHAHGHPEAHAYLPWQAGSGWGANWVEFRPTSIPAGYVGWQYDHSHIGRHFDLSVFRSHVFAPLIAATLGDTVNLDREAQAFIVANLDKLQANLVTVLGAISSDSDKDNPHPHALVHIHKSVTDLAAKVGTGGGATVDVPALAAALAVNLGPKLAADLAAELAARLSH